MYGALSPETPFAIIPQGNSIHGSVIESYDLFRLPGAGKDVFIRDEVVLKVQHCLIVRAGVRLQDITRVISHEQASTVFSTLWPPVSDLKPLT